MLLQFTDQEPFATGAQSYQSRPAAETDSSNRLFIRYRNRGSQDSVWTSDPYGSDSRPGGDCLSGALPRRVNVVGMV
jgi:hypothetical protein